MQNSIADISLFESLQAGQHSKTGMSQMMIFNNFTKKSDKALVVAIKARLDYIKEKGKSKSQEQADYDRELAWTEGVYAAAQKRIKDDNYE